MVQRSVGQKGWQIPLWALSRWNLPKFCSQIWPWRLWDKGSHPTGQNRNSWITWPGSQGVRKIQNKFYYQPHSPCIKIYGKNIIHWCFFFIFTFPKWNFLILNYFKFERTKLNAAHIAGSSHLRVPVSFLNFCNLVLWTSKFLFLSKPNLIRVLPLTIKLLATLRLNNVMLGRITLYCWRPH